MLRSLHVAVILPAYNPDKGRLRRVLSGLQRQTLDSQSWELVVVDNASTRMFPVERSELTWHPNARIAREDRPGLTWARLRGIDATTAPLVVFVDDDNVLSEDFLKVAIELANQFRTAGVWGGRIVPEFETAPATWVDEFAALLALRDFGASMRTEVAPCRTGRPLAHPEFLPVGAGMVVRRDVLNVYARETCTTANAVLDRTGASLSSGGDCMINLTALRHGWDVSYAPKLNLTHLIPAKRITPEYLGRVAHGSSRSWPSVLAAFGICPWAPISAWTVRLRKSKAWLTYRAWAGPAAYVRWRGACGLFEGLAAVSDARQRQP